MLGLDICLYRATFSLSKTHFFHSLGANRTGRLWSLVLVGGNFNIEHFSFCSPLSANISNQKPVVYDLSFDFD